MQTTTPLHRRLTSKSRVYAACEQLGEDVSARNVRVLLGGGSMRDITAHLKAWRAGASETAAVPAPETSAGTIVVQAALEEGLLRLDERLQRGLTNQSGRFEQLREAQAREIQHLRADVAELAAGLRRDRQQQVSTSVIPLDHSDVAPRELNAAIERIHRRLDELEQAPATAAITSIDQLAMQLGDVAAQLQRMNQWLETREAAAVQRHDAGVTALTDGQEALAETVGHMQQQGLALLADVLGQLDRKQAARISRLCALVRAPAAPPSVRRPASTTTKPNTK